GQCVGCRLERSRQWAIRVMHEASQHEHNCFITLTYNDDNLPANGSLNYRHFQNFMKRLRKYYVEFTVRFYMCGEYGENFARPHYHACIFAIMFMLRCLMHNTNSPLTASLKTASHTLSARQLQAPRNISTFSKDYAAIG
ncbi:MAG: hypothetical protein H7835_21005, partial [Magnetococcus sp. XQGC-1]